MTCTPGCKAAPKKKSITQQQQRNALSTLIGALCAARQQNAVYRNRACCPTECKKKKRKKRKDVCLPPEVTHGKYGRGMTYTPAMDATGGFISNPNTAGMNDNVKTYDYRVNEATQFQRPSVGDIKHNSQEITDHKGWYLMDGRHLDTIRDTVPVENMKEFQEMFVTHVDHLPMADGVNFLLAQTRDKLDNTAVEQGTTSIGPEQIDLDGITLNIVPEENGVFEHPAAQLITAKEIIPEFADEIPAIGTAVRYSRQDDYTILPQKVARIPLAANPTANFNVRGVEYTQPNGVDFDHTYDPNKKENVDLTPNSTNLMPFIFLGHNAFPIETNTAGDIVYTVNPLLPPGFSRYSTIDGRAVYSDHGGINEASYNSSLLSVYNVPNIFVPLNDHPGAATLYATEVVVDGILSVRSVLPTDTFIQIEDNDLDLQFPYTYLHQKELAQPSDAFLGAAATDQIQAEYSFSTQANQQQLSLPPYLNIDVNVGEYGGVAEV